MQGKMSPDGLFSDRLEQRMKSLGMSAADLARQTGLAQTNISRYLKGRIPASIELLSISMALGSSMEWLLTGQEVISERSVASLREEEAHYHSAASESIKMALAKTGEEMAKLADLLKREWGEKT